MQPRDYARPWGAPDRLDTLFGWGAPGIDPADLIERDRLWVAMAGWLVVGLVAGRLRPRLWPFIGPAVVLPTLLVYYATAPHDAEGWWALNAIFLPVAAGVVSVAALTAPKLDRLFGNPVLLACSAGALFAVGGVSRGESNAAVFVTAVATASTVGAVLLAARALASRDQR
ncbi:MAG: hypothetical protein FJW88_06425 [Actinobacteria bacterium]|nr:hypothetical protein [Actinomycetota bacterium]